METKTCSTCKEEKPLSAFGKLARSKDGYTGRCRQCINAYDVKYRADMSDESRVKRRASHNEWRQQNKDKVKAYTAKFYQNHKEELLAYQAAYRAKHFERDRERNNARTREWVQANPERAKAATRRWREANAEHLRELSRVWRVTEAGKQSVDRWRKANPDKVKDINKQAQLRRVREVSDSYVRGLIKAQANAWGTYIPPALVECKKMFIKIQRELKEKQA